MKITASRAEDIRKQRSEYDAETAKLREQYDANFDRYRQAEYEGEQDIEKQVRSAIGVTSLDISVRAQRSWSFRSGDRGWEVSVEVNHNKRHDDDIALAWNWDAKIGPDGEVVKDSGSWSGLNAVTAEQISDLEESVRVLKLLNNIDWKSILMSNLLKYEDFSDENLDRSLSDRERNRPNFENQASDAELESLIGTNVAVKVSRDEYWRGEVGILITKVSEKYVTGYVFSWTYVGTKTLEDIKEWAGTPRRIAKDKIVGYATDNMVEASLQ